MGNLIKNELSRAFGSPGFFVALAVGLVLVVSDAVMTIGTQHSDYLAALEGARLGAADGLESPSLWSCYTCWISVRYDTLYATMFYYLLPLLAVMPFAWSLVSERASGYISQIYVRTNRMSYFKAKVCAVFTSASSVAFLPQLINLLIMAAFFPAVTPDAFDSLYIGIFEDNLWAELFYSFPALYSALYLLLSSCLCGLWSVLVMSLGYITKNRIIVLVAPYLFLISLQLFNERIFQYLGGIRGMQLSLFENLHAYSVQYVQSGILIGIEMALMLAASLCIAWIGKREDEL